RHDVAFNPALRFANVRRVRRRCSQYCVRFTALLPGGRKATALANFAKNDKPTRAWSPAGTLAWKSERPSTGTTFEKPGADSGKEAEFTRLAHKTKPISDRPRIGTQITSFNFPNNLICGIVSSDERTPIREGQY
ncbi:MAG TPA: hypothetical protein VIY51_23655, partial [Xanthobacteraceae bacterium]